MECCPECGKECKSASGLASHRRAKHPSARARNMSVREAVDEDLDGVDGLEALKATALVLAKAMDQSTSARDLPSLAKELRVTLDELGVGEVDDGQEEDAVDELARRRAERRSAASGS